jgi:hypothetical protein
VCERERERERDKGEHIEIADVRGSRHFIKGNRKTKKDGTKREERKIERKKKEGSKKKEKI